jgi:hypothetical protein
MSNFRLIWFKYQGISTNICFVWDNNNNTSIVLKELLTKFIQI